MTPYEGRALSWTLVEGRVEVALDRAPCNEIGTAMLEDLEVLVAALRRAGDAASAVVFHSRRACGFSAGADLRELHARWRETPPEERLPRLREFLARIHVVLDALDGAPQTTIAAVHGVVFGGGFELALACDLIVADRTARFCFPELRLGIIPGFGGIPRLRRDAGNAVVRDLLLTGRSIGVQRAHAAGLVSQIAAEGRALEVARAAARQAARFDRRAAQVAKRYAKPIPIEELRREIDLFCELFARPEVEAALAEFVGRSDPMPYLPKP